MEVSKSKEDDLSHHSNRPTKAWCSHIGNFNTFQAYHKVYPNLFWPGPADETLTMWVSESKEDNLSHHSNCPIKAGV